jgi:hypothetical protein
MDFNQTVVIPSSTGISLPLDILTPALETNSESTFEINNTSKELIEEIRLTSLTLNLTSPSSADFSFLESSSVYIKSPGHTDV